MEARCPGSEAALNTLWHFFTNAEFETHLNCISEVLDSTRRLGAL
jgi:hypothetical protein